jgi:Flp pilus assembly protein TadD
LPYHFQAAAKVNQALKHAKSGNFEKAKNIFVEAVQMDPISADIWAHLGTTQEKLGLLDEAKSSFERAAMLDPTSLANVGVLDDQGQMGMSSDNLDDEDVTSALTDEAIDLAETGDLNGALRLFQAAAEKEPTNGKAWENLGVTQVCT